MSDSLQLWRLARPIGYSVFDQAGRILATVLTTPAARLTGADDTRITFAEQPAGARVSIKKWSYPGDLNGEEFIYPTHTD